MNEDPRLRAQEAQEKIEKQIKQLNEVLDRELMMTMHCTVVRVRDLVIQILKGEYVDYRS